jgi:hypothetical protein
MGLSLMNMLGFSSSVHFAHKTRYWKFFLLHYIAPTSEFLHVLRLQLFLTLLAQTDYWAQVRSNFNSYLQLDFVSILRVTITSRPEELPLPKVTVSSFWAELWSSRLDEATIVYNAPYQTVHKPTLTLWSTKFKQTYIIFNISVWTSM